MSRYRMHLVVRGERLTREIELDGEQPVIDVLNWLEDEYDFHANLKGLWILRDDGVEEQIY